MQTSQTVVLRYLEETACVVQATGCLADGKSSRQIKRSDEATKRSLKGSWGNGAEVSTSVLTDPASSEPYQLCIYAGAELVLDAQAAPRSVWEAEGSTGYAFKDKFGGGSLSLGVAGGAEGESKASAKSKGARIAGVAMTLAFPVTVQLRREGTSFCYENSFLSGDESANDEK